MLAARRPDQEGPNDAEHFGRLRDGRIGPRTNPARKRHGPDRVERFNGVGCMPPLLHKSLLS